MMRVLYIARAPFVSGAERALMSMLRHLDRRQVEPMLVLGCATALIEQARALDIPVRVIPLAQRSPARLWGWWRSLRTLRQVLFEFQPDILHANDVPSCQALSVLGAELGRPRVIHVRWALSAEEMAWWARRGAERVVCISRWVAQQLEDPRNTALAGARVEILPDAVDWPEKETVTKGRGLEIGGKKNVIGAETATSPAMSLGFAGQLIAAKGLDLVIEALGRLPADRRPRLLVAGEDTQSGGVYKRHLRELAERCGVGGNIEWLGFLPDVAELYQRIDAVICPSRVEPLGLVPLEAAAYCLPTLANRVGGLAETIVDGQTGYLVAPTVAAWVAALERLPPAAELARLGRAARERTQTLYAPAVYQRRLMEIYGELVAKQQPDPEGRRCPRHSTRREYEA